MAITASTAGLIILVAIVLLVSLHLRRQRWARTTRALTESEAKNKAILKALPDLMFLFDANGTYLDYYPKNPTVLYVPPEQFLGKNIRDVLPSDIGTAVVKKFEEASLTGDAATIEFCLTIQSVPRFREARIVQVQDGKYLAIVRDITADKQAAAELKRSNRFVQRIAETLPNFLFIYDRLERRHVYMNGGITAILGYSVCEIRGMGRDVLGNLVHPHDRPGLEAQFSNLKVSVTIRSFTLFIACGTRAASGDGYRVARRSLPEAMMAKSAKLSGRRRTSLKTSASKRNCSCSRRGCSVTTTKNGRKWLRNFMK